MFEIKNLPRTFYSDCYYKFICDTELDDCIHLRIDVWYISSHNIQMETFCNRFVYISGLLDKQRQIQKSLLFKFILLSNISFLVKMTMSFDSTRFQPTTIMDSVSIPKNEQRFRRDLKRKLVTCNHFIRRILHKVFVLSMLERIWIWQWNVLLVLWLLH